MVKSTGSRARLMRARRAPLPPPREGRRGGERWGISRQGKEAGPGRPTRAHTGHPKKSALRGTKATG
ncbi:hypothetical protein DVA76_18415, partial [Acinetobacter baumannii]